MIKVVSHKTNHPLYNHLKDSVNNIKIKETIYIVGLDINGSIDHDTYKQIFSEIYTSASKFLLYLEEPSTFASMCEEEGSPHWQVNKSLPFSVINNIINDDKFLGFISHLKSVCGMMSQEYGVPCFYLPLYNQKKNYKRINDSIESLTEYNRPIKLLNWGTYNSDKKTTEDAAHYINRGGLIIEYLIDTLLRNDIKCNYTLRAEKNYPLKQRFPDKINLIDKYLTDDELDEIFYNADIFLLPADQVRACSVTKAFSFGIPCLVTNEWGFDEYCIDGFNSIIMKNNNCDNCRNRGLPVCEHILLATLTRITNLVNNRKTLQDLRRNTLFDNCYNYTQRKHIFNIKNILEYLNIE